jgi:hypothetical protein
VPLRGYPLSSQCHWLLSGPVPGAGDSRRAPGETAARLGALPAHWHAGVRVPRGSESPSALGAAAASEAPANRRGPPLAAPRVRVRRSPLRVCQHLPVARAGPGGLPAGPLGTSWGCNLDPDSDTAVTGRLRLTSGLLWLFGLGQVLARQPASGHITRPKSETTGMRVKESQDSFSTKAASEVSTGLNLATLE